MAKEKKLSFRHFTKKLRSIEALYIRILYDRKTTVVRSYSEKSLTGEGEWPADYIKNDSRIINNLWTYFKDRNNNSLDVNLFNQQGNDQTSFLVDDFWNTISTGREKKILRIMEEKGYRRLLELMPDTVSADDILKVISDINRSAADEIFDLVKTETYLSSLVYHISSKSNIESDVYYFPERPPKFNWVDPTIIYIANIDLLDKSITGRIESELLRFDVNIDVKTLQKML